ncbi:MAG TPA: L-histidine N(alpha)-methyltransferase, partial [Alphaproteobacteria bacterium]|nr:L-histidine N(alpha)-methyltransferase [Alphaproteobacteria bacterium]
MPPDAARFRCVRLAAPEQPDTGHDIAAGFSARPRTLPCRYFYDARGSELFER